VIEELLQGVGQYQFAHALIQETLAAELSTIRRVRLHARIAETLENLYGANAEAHAAELAYHFAEAATATDTDKLVHYLLVAGEQALASYAWEEALDHFQQGLDTKEGLPMDGDTAALLFGLGRAQAATVERRRPGEVVTNLSRAFDYYAGAGDVAHAVAVAESPVLHLPGQIEGRMRLVDQALDLVLTDSHEAGHLLSLYCSDLGIDAGDYDGAQEAFRRALAIAGHEQDESLEMQALARAAAVDGYHLRFPESLEKNLRAIKLAQKLDDPVYEISSRFFAALALWSTGDLATARTHARAGLALAERLRDRFWLASMLWANEIICRLEGDFQTAIAFNERGLVLLPRDPRLLGTRSLMEFEISGYGSMNIASLRIFRTRGSGISWFVLSKTLRALLVLSMTEGLPSCSIAMERTWWVTRCLIGAWSTIKGCP